MLKVAFMVHPLPYGLYTVYRNLRWPMARHGWSCGGSAWRAGGRGIRRPGVGRRARTARSSPPGGPQTPERVSSPTTSPAATTRSLQPPLYYALETNLLRYPSTADPPVPDRPVDGVGIYRPITAIRQFTHLAVASSSARPATACLRLSEQSAPSSSRMALTPPLHESPAPAPSPPLRLLYLGRIENNQKGVFSLPTLMEQLRDVDATLTVAGGGRTWRS